MTPERADAVGALAANLANVLFAHIEVGMDWTDAALACALAARMVAANAAHQGGRPEQETRRQLAATLAFALSLPPEAVKFVDNDKDGPTRADFMSCRPKH